MKRARTTAVLMTGVLAFGLAACGDDGDKKASSTTTLVTQPAPVGLPVVSIDLVENAFQVSGPLVTGGTLRFSNKGTEIHMALMERFKAGKTMTDLQAVLAKLAAPPTGASTTIAGATTTTARGATTTTGAGATTTTAAGATTTSTARTATSTTLRGATTTTVAGNENPFIDVLEDTGGFPGAVISPGETAEVTVPTLPAGTYALICFVPGEGDGVPHFAEGMVGQLDVVAGAIPAEPTADATYKVTKGKAIEGPATLTAGRHTLKFEVAAGGNQLEPTLLRLNPGTTFTAADAAFTKFFESATPPAKGATAKLPAQIVYGGLDLGGVTSFYLSVELKAGTYVINAEDTDVTPKPPTKELINIKVS